MRAPDLNKRYNILGLGISAIPFQEAIQKVLYLGSLNTPSYICFANVHMTIEAYKNQSFAEQVNNATYVFADGVPLTKASKLLYDQSVERIAGMDFMPQLLREMNLRKEKVFFYGATEEILNHLKAKLQKLYPNLQLVGFISPPFRMLTSEEQDSYINQINEAKPNVVFVGLGCPKQEKWMSNNYHKVNATLLGVGGAFSTVAELKKRAPIWMQKNGLEWLHRLYMEPRRLFKRYFITNSLFIYLLGKAWIKKNLNAK